MEGFSPFDLTGWRGGRPASLGAKMPMSLAAFGAIVTGGGSGVTLGAESRFVLVQRRLGFRRASGGGGGGGGGGADGFLVEYSASDLCRRRRA